MYVHASLVTSAYLWTFFRWTSSSFLSRHFSDINDAEMASGSCNNAHLCYRISPPSACLCVLEFEASQTPDRTSHCVLDTCNDVLRAGKVSHVEYWTLPTHQSEKCVQFNAHDFLFYPSQGHVIRFASFCNPSSDTARAFDVSPLVLPLISHFAAPFSLWS